MQREKTPKISVCVITYNHEKYIRQCLQSIVDQETDFDFEVIVGDDFSTDNTRLIIQEFAEKYPDLIKPIFREKNIGGSKNIFEVHKAAIGEYIAHIDGDDYWLPDKLTLQVAFLDNHEECVAVYSNAFVIKNECNVIGIFSSGVKETFNTDYLIKKGNFLTQSSMMYRATLRDTVFPRQDDFIDYHIHIKLSENGRLGYIDKNLVAYRSDSTVSNIKNRSADIRLLYWQALLDIDISKTKKTAIYCAFSQFLTRVMIYELDYGSFSNYRNWLNFMRSNTPVNIYFVQSLALFLFVNFAYQKIVYKIKKSLKISNGDKRVIYPR
jgi:glycosyltransferase involved in cell wall biosynthesis